MQRLLVLHRRPLGESGQLLNVLAEDHGHLLLHAPRRRERHFDLYHLYEADWQADAEWPRVVASLEHQAFDLDGDYLYCGFYLNELLVRLLPRGEAVPVLFDRYLKTLAAFSQRLLPDPWLRVFEYQLLQLAGYGFAWHLDHVGEAVLPDCFYRFVPQQGFVRARAGWPGHWLLSMAAGNANTECWRMARLVLRQALDAELGQPASSRELLFAPDAETRPMSRN